MNGRRKDGAPTLSYFRRKKPLTFPKEGKAGIAPGLVHVNVPTALAKEPNASNSACSKSQTRFRLAN